ncbi:hypothetical protein D0859_08443 [Hortaea werneckii]|uniref:SUN-domain-containing protein n=1 Tax=Hortaea werneckii TaxID=91943 RepID=A0A3M7IPV8_HORWE|nr:hypothetical protein D0859_08443 [Hortaea werneckii]
MKYTIALFSAAVMVTAAQPHRHAHQHLHKDRREALPNPAADPDVVVVPGPTEIAYVLNGNPISESDVMEGIKNGTLVWKNGGSLSSVASSEQPSATSYNEPSSTSTSQWVAPTTSSESSWEPESTSQAWTSSSEASSSSSEPSTSSSSYSAPASSSASSSSSSGGDDSDFDHDYSNGLDTDFPDGELDCDTFPSDYGAVAVNWMGLGGWTGIQSPGSLSKHGGFSNIKTITSNLCLGGSCCSEGSFCSYACPAGYQKSQWPTTQGSTGQSVGGIKCENGKLRLTNPDLSSKLCMTGTDKVNVVVQNKLSNNVAVCRTDYPGTESETVPVNAQPGSTSNLTCPDADNYYKWQGGHTSAQYYVNPAGVSVDNACQWGSDANPWGNFAPLNLGVGYSNGAAWLSIFQNLPTTSQKLDFAVEITGDGLSGTCKYSNGQYCSGENYDQCSSSTGCTVSLSSGTATIVFSDS